MSFCFALSYNPFSMSYQIIATILIGFLLGLGVVLLIGRLLRPKTFAPTETKPFSEQEVEGLLKKSGFEIEAKNPKASIITNIDGQDHYGEIQADYLVSQNKNKYVVIVKTGIEPLDPNEPAMRRRLLEYHHGFNSRGIIVLDPNQGQLNLVKFSFPQERNLDFFMSFFTAVLAILAIIGIIWLLAHLRFF